MGLSSEMNAWSFKVKRMKMKILSFYIEDERFVQSSNGNGAWGSLPWKDVQMNESGGFQDWKVGAHSHVVFHCHRVGFLSDSVLLCSDSNSIFSSVQCAVEGVLVWEWLTLNYVRGRKPKEFKTVGSFIQWDQNLFVQLWYRLHQSGFQIYLCVLLQYNERLTRKNWFCFHEIFDEYMGTKEYKIRTWLNKIEHHSLHHFSVLFRLSLW